METQRQFAIEREDEGSSESGVMESAPESGRRIVRTAEASSVHPDALGSLDEQSCRQTSAPGSTVSPWRLPALPYVFSAKSATALRGRAAALAARLQRSPQLNLHDLGYSFSLRPSFEHRAVLFAEGRAEAIQAISAMAEGRGSVDCVQGTARPSAKLAFLFSGHGSQHAGMGHALYAAFPEFAAAFDAVCERFSEHSIVALRKHAFAAKGSEPLAQLEQTRYAQAAIFAFEVALFRLLQAWGVAPEYLLGHSLGEVAAAHVAGVFSLHDACKLVAAQGLLTQAYRADGAMLAIRGGEEEVTRSLDLFPGRLEIAMLDGPLATVVAGDAFALAGLAEHWRHQSRKVRALRVNHAFHSRHMERLLPMLRRVAHTISFAAPSLPLISSTTGELATAETLRTPEYWVQHVRRAVRFADGMRTLANNGVTAFLELGPDALLSGVGPTCLEREHRARSVFVPSQRRGDHEVRALLASLATLFVHGVGVRWRAAFRV